jgi:hypothetical protein
MGFAGAFDQRRFAVERRKMAEAALEQAHGEPRAWQREQVQAAEERWGERIRELARLRMTEAAVQRFRERLPW